MLRRALTSLASGAEGRALHLQWRRQGAGAGLAEIAGRSEHGPTVRTVEGRGGLTAAPVSAAGERSRAPESDSAYAGGTYVSGVENALPGEARVLRAAEEALAGERRGLRALLPFLGPAFIASVAYIDPGNFATNMASGAEFGYALGWVVLTANLFAMLIQTLSAKLGIATGQSLPEVCRARLPRRFVVGLWLQAEAVAMATDLAEFTGAALGLHLVFGLSIWLSALLAALATFAVLGMEVH